MIARDVPLERDTLERAERVTGVTGFADAVVSRMNDVEAAGGPDVPATTALRAVEGAHEEAVDQGAWILVARALLEDDAPVEVEIQLEDAMAAAAHAEYLLRGAVALLGG